MDINWCKITTSERKVQKQRWLVEINWRGEGPHWSAVPSKEEEEEEEEKKK
jgi:hypothetical protein